MNKDVLVGMSGGVDSSIAALKLKLEGHNPIGITFRIWEPNNYNNLGNDTEKAEQVCKKLKIEHRVVSVSEKFEHSIVENFVNEYLSGVTPNPCVECNKLIKWKTLIELADSMGIEFISTGHYARVLYNSNSQRYEIHKGTDNNKDQSYMLWRLSQDDLKRTILPLGDLTKSQVRALASNYEIPFDNNSESQDICFIPEKDYRDFIKSYAFRQISKIPEGEFVDERGNLLGRHKGFYNYTIGQRKGLRIAFGERRYVKEIDARHNRVVLSDSNGLLSSEMTVSDTNWVSIKPISYIEGIMKIRYRHKGAKCKVETERDNIIEVKFLKPQRAITPGQSAVLYQGDKLILGGIIQKSI
jgi:tRNA-specific 2-thiouridylase